MGTALPSHSSDHRTDDYPDQTQFTMGRPDAGSARRPRLSPASGITPLSISAAPCPTTRQETARSNHDIADDFEANTAPSSASARGLVQESQVPTVAGWFVH